MSNHEQQLLAVAEALYAWALLPHRRRLLAEIKEEADKVLRIYESPLPSERARLEKEASRA